MEKPEAQSEIRLTILETPAVYTSQQLQVYAERATALVAKVIYSSKGLVLNETQRQKIAAKIRDELFPALASVPVYAEEFEQLLDTAEQSFEENLGEQDGLLWFRFYQSNLSVLGSSRAGRAGYLFVRMWLASQEQICRERYEKYGYSWYLEDAERYARLITELIETLGEDGFSSAVEMLTFVASLVGGATVSSSAALYGLTAGELADILEKQVAHFKENSLTQDQWRIVGSLLNEAVPERNNTLFTAELNALAESFYFSQAAEIVPFMLTLYGAVINGMTMEMADEIFGEDENSRIIALCRRLAVCEDELMAVLNAFASCAATQSACEERALKSVGQWEACQSFLMTADRADAESLRASILACSMLGTEESVQRVKNTLQAYFCTQIPYLYYALQFCGREIGYARGNATV